MKRRKLGWRQRNDIIEYMNKVGWVQEFDDHGLKSYRISKAGKQELKTAYGLYEAVREAAHTLHDQGVSGDQAKATAAAVIAAALRVDARSGPSDSRTHAAASANEIEDAVRARDPARVDRIVTRTRDTLQIATYALPFVRDILRIIGSL